MPFVFLLASWIAIGFKWGIGSAIALVIFRLVLPKPRWNSSFAYVLFLYFVNVGTWVLGVIAVTHLLGDIWGAVMALIIAVREIVVNSK